MKPRPSGWFPIATNGNPTLPLKINSSAAQRAERPVSPGSGAEGSWAVSPYAVSRPSSSEFGGEGGSNPIPPGAGSPLLAVGRTPDGGGRRGGRWHPTHLKSRSRPWVWLVKRVKASMAPSPRPRVAGGAVATPPGRLRVPAGGSASGRRRCGVSPPLGAGAPSRGRRKDFRSGPEVVVTRATRSLGPR